MTPARRNRVATALALALLTAVQSRAIASALFQQFWSFAGEADRPSLDYLFFDPNVTKLLPKGQFLNFGPSWKFDWKNREYTIPLNLGYGRALSESFTFSIQPEYVVSGPDKGNFAFSINFEIILD